MPGTVDNKQIYSLKVLIPFWVLELINVILLLAFGALDLQFFIYYLTAEYCYDDSYYGYSCYSYSNSETSPGLVVAAVGGGYAVGLSVIFLILHITQIALFGRRRLTPAANFGFELPRIILLTILLVIMIAGAAIGDYDYAVLSLTCTLWLLYLGTLIYSCIIFHRSRRGRYNGGGAPGYGYGYAGNHGAVPYHPGPYQQSQYPPGPYQQPQYPQAAFHQGPYQQQQQPGQYQPAFQPQNQYPPQNGTPVQHHNMSQQSKAVQQSPIMQQPQPQHYQQQHQSISSAPSAPSAPSDRSPGSPYQESAIAPPPPHVQEMRADN